MSDDHADGAVAARVRHVETLLEERGVLAPGEVDAKIDEVAAGGSPAHGARVVARAWADADFRARLLDDGDAAVAELGYTMAAGLAQQWLRVVANGEHEHNVVVCTLCSCYPISLLGPSPGWYKSEAYRAQVVRDPRGVLAEFGLHLPPSTRITVWDASAESRYLVLPRRPAGTESLGEEELAGLVTRQGLVGTAAV